ncbi:MAG: class I SAM-dependent methyltransferase [Chloroflexi bacterium]|nr:class I SAM-dependent methyltransferase [Chloroflexota bacterium]
MDPSTLKRLNQINRDFYRATAAEFDATRQSAWQGWERLLNTIQLPIESALDLGCGNGRLARFLAARQRQPFRYVGIDSNADLLTRARQQLSALSQVSFQLIQRDLVLNDPPRELAQLTALFGLIHHVPGFARRRALLKAAADCLLPGGCLVFACWRFYEYERFRQRIIPWPEDIAVERHDYLLDWRRGETALRYCHYVDDEEHGQLIAATGLSAIADYRADGAEGDLNRYTLLQK